MRIYLANPLGFSDAGKLFLSQVMLPRLKATGHAVIEPFSMDLAGVEPCVMEIGKANAVALDRCEIVVAVLDGPDVDSGTAAEIGFAFARGKRIIGYRGDSCRTGDLSDSTINCQVEYFIRASGGAIVRDLDALVAAVGT